MCTLPSPSVGEPTATKLLFASVARLSPNVLLLVGLWISSSKLYAVDAFSTAHLLSLSTLSIQISSLGLISVSAYLLASSSLATRFDNNVEITPANPVSSVASTPFSPNSIVILFKFTSDTL